MMGFIICKSNQRTIVQLVIIAVMDLKRQPYMLRDERQKSMAIDRKIIELEEKAQKQSKQVRQLMLGGNTLRYSQNNQHHSPVNRIENEQIQNKTQTARKRPKNQDYLKYSGRINTQPSTQDPTKKGWEPPPVVNLPPRPQEKLEDKQMQYLKSQEYKKYLQKLLGVDKKEDKVKYMKQNRNHNIYLGNNGGQKRDYIQAMLKSKQVLPRAHNFGYERYPYPYYPQRQMVSNSYRRSISPLNSYRKQKISRYQYEQVKQLPKQNCLFQSPIKEAKQMYEGDITKKQMSQNCTLILSPVCIKKASKQQQQPKKIEKPDKIKLENKSQSKKAVKQYDISQKQNKKPIVQRVQKLERRSNYTDHKINWEKQTPKNNQTSAKVQIYKKEIQFNNKKVKSIEKGEKYNKKSKKLQTCRYKIIPQQQSLSEKSKSSGKYYENQSQYSQDTKSPSKKIKDIYNVSFKLDKPKKISEKRSGQIGKKQSSYQNKSLLKGKNILSHRTESYKYYEKQHNNIDYRRFQQKRKRQNTQLYYEQNIPYNYYYPQQEVGLQYSQTQSATTLQTDKHQNSKSPRKISIISKSKMK